MKDNWISHNTDKLLLFLLVLLSGSLIIHIIHHGIVDEAALAWAEHTFDVVLGALILILTGRVNRADGQTANGVKPDIPLVPQGKPATGPITD